jgi:hypothetical protein
MLEDGGKTCQCNEIGRVIIAEYFKTALLLIYSEIRIVFNTNSVIEQIWNEGLRGLVARGISAASFISALPIPFRTMIDDTDAKIKQNNLYSCSWSKRVIYTDRLPSRREETRLRAVFVLTFSRSVNTYRWRKRAGCALQVRVFRGWIIRC